MLVLKQEKGGQCYLSYPLIKHVTLPLNYVEPMVDMKTKYQWLKINIGSYDWSG